MLLNAIRTAAFCCFIPGLSAYAQPAQPLSLGFGPLIQLPAGASPRDVAVADFDHDGRADLAITERGLDTLAIFTQTAAGGFRVRPTARYYINAWVHTLVAVALDGYGPAGSPAPPADDLVVGTAGSGQLHFFDNRGTAPGVTLMVPRPYISWNPLGGSVPVNPRLLTAPLNEDAYPDVAYLYDPQSGPPMGAGGLTIFPTANGTGPLRPRLMFQTNFRAFDLTLAAMLVPGEYNAIMAAPLTNEIVMAEANARAGSLPNDPWWTTGFQQNFPSFGLRPVSAAGGDLNGDGLADLVAAHETSLDLVVQLRDPAQPTQVALLPGRLSYPLLGPPRQVVLQDLTGDGRPELIVLLSNALVQVFYNTGQPGPALFGAPLFLGTGTDPAYLRLADLNADGRLDMAVACAGDNTVHTFYNQSPVPTATASASRRTVLRAYPNPARTTLQLQVPTGVSITHVVLRDALGRQVREWTTATGPLTVADLPRGWYLLQAATAAGLSTQRVVLE